MLVGGVKGWRLGDLRIGRRIQAAFMAGPALRQGYVFPFRIGPEEENDYPESNADQHSPVTVRLYLSRVNVPECYTISTCFSRSVTYQEGFDGPESGLVGFFRVTILHNM